MSVSRRAALGAAGLAATGGLVLSACGGEIAAATGPRPGYCVRGSLSGQGSSFQQNAQLQWIADYQHACPGAQIAYQGTGSGAGKAAFDNGTADFGGTDSLPKPSEQAAADTRCAPGKGILTPIVAGAAVLTYNLRGVTDLTLDAPTSARIFEKQITRWDDPAIKKLNPDASLPSITIVPVVRTDKSGTTNIFSSWLAADAGRAWTLRAGETVDWPEGIQAAKGSDGVSTAVKQSVGGLAYTELSFVALRHLPTARIVNPAGRPVRADAASVSAALQSAKVDTTHAGLRVTPDYATTNPVAFPLASPTFVLTCSTGNASPALLRSYLTYALTVGQAVLDPLGYAPLPASINSRALAQIAGLR